MVLDQKTVARQYSRTLKWVLCSNRRKEGSVGSGSGGGVVDDCEECRGGTHRA